MVENKKEFVKITLRIRRELKDKAKVFEKRRGDLTRFLERGLEREIEELEQSQQEQKKK